MITVKMGIHKLSVGSVLGHINFLVTQTGKNNNFKTSAKVKE